MKQDIGKLLKNPPFELIVILVTLAAYIISLSIFVPKEPGETELVPLLLAGLVCVEILYFVGTEIKEGADKKGWKHEAIDTLIAVVIAVALWFGLGFILNTSTPISAVASCSMLPSFERGDFIIVQGSKPNAYEITMTAEELESLVSGSVYVEGGGEEYVSPYPFFNYCQCRPNDELCKSFGDNPEGYAERIGPFTYHYAECGVSYRNGAEGIGPCLEYVEFKGKRYYNNFSNDVIVYAPQRGDYYYGIGDIVHRAFFRIESDGKTYYLTKGDNNPILDIQNYPCSVPDLRNRPVPEGNLRGKVIVRVPYLGYLKLFVSGLWAEDAQCSWTMSYATVN